ncbi:MAG: riboflavin biosynthesis protein RibF [Clostridia bacterium]|nr:riboflavin biosynthesis protein RibF [Clostridia bacterium]
MGTLEIRDITSATDGKTDETAVALGTFDGMHAGHRTIIDAAVKSAADRGLIPAVFTFRDPPARYLCSEKTPLLSNTEERCDLFFKSGIKRIYIADFPSFMNLSPSDFISDILVDRCRAKSVVCGFNFTFGKDGTGKSENLARYFKDSFKCVPASTYEGTPISSSRIRQQILKGNVTDAASMLGRPYSFSLPVIHGRHDGTALGFPTLNQIPTSDRAIPATGVYITYAILSDGQRISSVTDVGVAPTLDNSGILRFETHLLDTSADLYGKRITVEFLQRIRPEITFSDPSVLAAQISSDVAKARLYFSFCDLH